MAFKLPSIPVQGVEKNTKLSLDTLSGRMGFAGRAILMDDLIAMGLVQFKEGINSGNIGGADPGDVIEVPVGELPDNPTTPTSLSTATSWGAIFITWEYQAYNSEYGTEIHRSRDSDRNNAVLIGVATGRSYTDNVGEKEVYFYWVRNRSNNGTVSGFNQLVGVQGESNLITTAEDFLLANPEAAIQPFTIANYGTDIAPDWKILLNGQTIITSDLSIGQLLSGEMRPNTVFTIGNSSIEIGTDSLGFGYMNIAGDGGIAGNDYLRLTDGAIKSFIYSNGQHVNYKELRRVERGITNSGADTVIPAYFKSEPTVYLTPHNISVYNPLYSAQGQTLVLQVGNILPTTGVEGSWFFSPTAGLVLADAIDTKVENINTTVTGDYTINSAYTFYNAESATVNAFISSSRLASAGLYQKRNSTLKIYVQPDSGGSWQLVSTLSKEHDTSLTDIPFNLTFNFPYKGDWTIQYQFSSADSSGTFSSGADSYEYAEDTSTSGVNISIENDTNNNSVNGGKVQSNKPYRDPDWIMYAIDFKADYTLQSSAWLVCYKACVNPTTALYSQGVASASVPGASSLANDGLAFSNGVCDGYPTSGDDTQNRSGEIGTNGKITISDNQEPYYSGRYSENTCKVNGTTIISQAAFPDTGCTYGTAKSKATVNNYNVTYYYRRPKVVSTTPSNHYQISSIDVSLGATDISLNNAVIGWLAVGE